MAKLKLEATDYLEDFKVWNLYSDANPVFLAYHINETLNFRLRRSRKDVIYCNGTMARFPEFNYYQPRYDVDWKLISNKGFALAHKDDAASRGSGNLFTEAVNLQCLLMPKMKMVPYFLICNGYLHPSFEEECLQGLRSITSLRKIDSVNLTRTKEIENILFPHYADK